MIYTKNDTCVIMDPNVIMKHIFLAGPIQGARDWQSEIINDIKDLPLVILSPRKKFLDKNFEYNKQVEWETYNLNKADIIIFYLTPEEEKIEGRSYAQTSRFELGEWLAKSKNLNIKIIVCVEDGFEGKRYIDKRIQDDYKDVLLCSTYDDLLNNIKNYYNYILYI